MRPAIPYCDIVFVLRDRKFMDGDVAYSRRTSSLFFLLRLVIPMTSATTWRADSPASPALGASSLRSLRLAR
jgi:hypothetical protein